MVKTFESRFPPSLNLDKVTVSYDKLINATEKVEQYPIVSNSALRFVWVRNRSRSGLISMLPKLAGYLIK